jgi:parallel beta-helix repeat protein
VIRETPALDPAQTPPIIDGGSSPGDAFLIENGVSNVTIQGFEIRNFTSDDTGIGNGISAWEASTSYITIQDNYFHDLGYNGVLVGNDHAAGDHSNWLIKGNIVADVDYIGFELTNTSNSSIEGNVIHLNSPDIGAIFSSARRSESGLTIKNNLIDGTPSTAFPVIYIYAYDLDMANPNLNSVLIQGNTISTVGTPYQIYVRNIGTGTVTGVVVDHNKLSTLKNLTAAQVDAENNYWGTVIFLEIVPKISGSVDWSPWCNSDFSVCTYTWPVHNITQGIDYQTIQAAVTAANPGDVIEADAGTYNERVAVNKALDLRGAQYGVDPTPGGARTTPASESIITEAGLSTPNPDVLIEIASGVSNVIIDGFTLDGDPTNATADTSTIRCWSNNIVVSNNIITGRVGILYKGANTLTADANLVTVNKTGVVVQPNAASNVTVSDSKFALGASPAGDETAIYLSLCTDCVVTGNSASGFAAGRVLHGSAVNRLIVTDNTFTGNRDALSIFGGSTFVTIEDNDLSNNTRYGINIKGQDITVSGNKINNNTTAGMFLDMHVIDTQRVTVFDNDLSGNPALALKIGTAGPVETVNASGNWWGSNVAATVRAQANGGTLVDYTPWLDVGTDTSTDPGFQGDFSTLWVDDDSAQTGSTGRVQEGVNLISGSTVNILDGTYTATSLTSILIAKDNVSLIGQSRDGTIIDAGSWGTSTSGWPRGIQVKANNATIKNMTVQGFTGDEITTGGYGIVFRDWDHDMPAEGYIYYTGGHVENVKLQNNYSALYALVHRNLTIHNSLIQNNDADAMFIARESDDATITDNTVLNAGNHGIWVGICWSGLGPSDNAVITGNTVDGAVEGGISFVHSAGATISGNDVSHVKGGGWSVGAISLKDSVSNVTVSNNVVHDNSATGCPGDYAPCTGRGIGIDGTSSNVTLSGNAVMNNAGGGIKVEGTATGFSAHNNAIMGNTGYGAEATTAVWLDFTDNFWGHSSGPADAAGTNECLPCNTDPALDKNADGTGNAVSSKVDYCPWLEYVPPEADLQALVDASCGGTLYLGPYTYQGGITIHCALTIKGVPGTVITPGSHGMTVDSDDVTLDTMTYDGGGGGGGSCGIWVNDGISRLWVRNCEILDWPDDATSMTTLAMASSSTAARRGRCRSMAIPSASTPATASTPSAVLSRPSTTNGGTSTAQQQGTESMAPWTQTRGCLARSMPMSCLFRPKCVSWRPLTWTSRPTRTSSTGHNSR